VHLADLAERVLAERQSNMLNFLNMLAATKQRLNGANPDAVALPDSLSAGAKLAKCRWPPIRFRQGQNITARAVTLSLGSHLNFG
jgi:hypothetical protein